MRLNLSVDTRPAINYLTSLAKATGATIKDVTIRESAAIWKLAASKYKPASKAQIRKEQTEKTLRKVTTDKGMTTLSVTKKGKVWFSKDNKENWQLAGYNKTLVGGWRLNKEDFKEARRLNQVGKTRLKENLTRTLENRGLAGGSFLAAIQSLGFLNVDSLSPKSKRINQAVKVQAQRNKLGYASVNATPDTATVLMVNQSKVAIRQGAAGVVAGAIRIRAAFFKQNLKRGILQDAATRAKAYPGCGFNVEAIPPAPPS